MLGQAAMEYLVTYGWALLALFMVVAFLFSSGVFSTGSFSVQECVFQPDLPCSPFILYKTSSTSATLQFNLSNGMGVPMKVTNVSYSAFDLAENGRADYPGTAPAGLIASGGKMDFAQPFSGTKTVSAHDFRNIYVTLEYQICKPGFPSCSGPYTTSGRVSAAVEG